MRHDKYTNWDILSDGRVYSLKVNRYLTPWKDRHGYFTLRYKRGGKSVRVHSLVAELFIGPKPSGKEIDHIDRDRQNNNYWNLRYVSRSQNNYNGKLRIDNNSGHKGVSFHKSSKKWTARLSRTYLGLFDSIESAIQARKKAEASL